ncbi:MAG: hypothetical protein Q9163_003958 [Psora crenata]
MDVPVNVQVGDPNADTEWNDILRRHGIIPEKPPSPTPVIQEALHEACKQAHENRLETKDINELNDLEDEEDDAFLERYRQQRLAELSTVSKTSLFNQVYPLQKPDYSIDVTEASTKSFVLVHLTSSLGSNIESRLLTELWRDLALRFGDVKFCEIKADMCIEGYPERNTPTILVYKDGEIKKQVVTLKELGGERTSLKDLEVFLVKVGVVKPNDYRVIGSISRDEDVPYRTTAITKRAALKPRTQGDKKPHPSHDTLGLVVSEGPMKAAVDLHTGNAFNEPINFQFFDQNATFDPTHLVAPPHSPPISLHKGQTISNLIPFESSGSLSNEMTAEGDFGDQAMRGSSDEDKDNLTPAQSRRKAQNRAAQRAFRERKERRVKDLEVKLKSIEAQSTDLLSDNERLRRELDKLATQNEILRATSKSMGLRGQPHPLGEDPNGTTADPDSLAASTIYSPSTFKAAFSYEYNPGGDEPISHRVAVSPRTGERRLAVGSAWDFILKHELYRKGMVDLVEVVDRLREKAVCDGTGPSFLESEVVDAIEASMGVPGDELI